MTLDGHIKTGLAASLFITTLIPSMYNVPSEIIPFVIVAFFLGNIGPDLLEFRVIPHRTITHYPPLYILLAIGCYIAIENGYSMNWLYGLLFFSIGSITHIISDIPYGGIPYFNPRRKITLMRVEFDSVANRIIEHTVLVLFLFGYLALNTSITKDISDFVSTTISSSEFSISKDKHEEN